MPFPSFALTLRCVEVLLRHRRVDARENPLVMGILNVTPDSFSDGGECLSVDRAVERARHMIDQGAALIDVGPESTRPGALPVPADEQIHRAIPLIEAIRRLDDSITLSIDTRLAEVFRAALSAGADWLNDISALRDDPDMAALVASSGTSVMLMHMRGSPADMQRGGGPTYDDVVADVLAFLLQRRDFALAQGIPQDRIILDPGIGFGKRSEHNWLLLQQLHRFTELGQAVMIGASRKSFLGFDDSRSSPKNRVPASLACAAIAVMKGACLIRAHDVRETVDVIRTCRTVCRGGEPSAQ